MMRNFRKFACVLLGAFALSACSQSGDISIPAAPAAARVTPGYRQLVLSWPAVAGAGEYDVYISPGPAEAPPDTPFLSVSAPEAVITGLEDNAPYRVWTAALNSAGQSGLSPPADGQTGGPLDPRLIGVWKWDNGVYHDGYALHEDGDLTTFSYDDGFNGLYGFSYTGVIRYVDSFSPAAGVIIIEYAPGGWPRYIEILKDGRLAIPGPFFGVYYSGLTDTSVVMANSTSLDSTPLYAPPETLTLAEAIAKFTEADKARFVASGVAQIQEKQ
jgi:hypothetical protein